MKSISIKQGNVGLATFTDEHLHNPAYFNWLKQYDVVRYIGRPEYIDSLQFPTVEEYVKNLYERKDVCFFAIYYETNFIGTFKIGDIDSRNLIADIGIMIGDANYRGKGLALDVMKAGCQYAFNEMSLRKLKGGCLKENAPMDKLFRSTGFVLEGTLRKAHLLEEHYVDHNLYGMFYEEFQY